MMTLAASFMAEAPSVGAAVLTPQQALVRARTHSGADMHFSLRSMLAAQGAHLSYTLAHDGQASVYAFNANDGRGWLMTSADDKGVPLLAYSTTGQFSAKDMPPALNEMLLHYQQEIAGSRRNDSNAYSSIVSPRRHRMAIEPLLTSQWNQSAPYNNLCPMSGSHHSPTGCVATAMAQIMDYHKYPTQGIGKVSYRDHGRVLSLDLADVHPQWQWMLPQYIDSAYTADEARAVAVLMQAAGYSIGTTYGNTASAAPTPKVAQALKEYWGYDPSVRYVERQNYDLLQWEDMLYDNLRRYGPVQMRGVNPRGAHSFVCDGANGSGMFHINWGWGGQSDGYFMLSALEPSSQGIGGSTAGYNDALGAVINISPPRGGVPYNGLVSRRALTASYDARKDMLTLRGRWENDGTVPFSGLLRVDVEDLEGHPLRNLKRISIHSLRPTLGYNSIDIAALSRAGLPDGIYRLRLSYVADGTDGRRQPIRGLNTQAGYVVLLKYGAHISVAVPLRYDTYVKSAVFLTGMPGKRPLILSARVSTTTPSPEIVALTPVIYTAGNHPRKVMQLPGIYDKVTQGDNILLVEGTAKGKSSQRDLAPGQYSLAFEYNIGEGPDGPIMLRASDLFPFTVTETTRQPTVTSSRAITSMRIYATDGRMLSNEQPRANTAPVVIDDWPPGSYILRLVHDNNTVTSIPFTI